MKVIYTIFMILGCFLGAGFVSGREIAFYFSKFGEDSYLSICVASILLFLLILYFLRLSKVTNSFDKFCKAYFGKFAIVSEWLFAICVLTYISSMFAGTMELAEIMKINNYLVLCITIILAFLVVIGNMGALAKINLLFVPIMIFVMFLISNFCVIDFGFESNFIYSMFSGINYIFINIVSLGLFLLEIGDKLSKKQSVLVSLIVTIIIGILLFGLNNSIILQNLVGNVMPNLKLSENYRWLFVVMKLCLYLGLFTTLVSNVYIFAKFINKYLHNRFVSIIITICSGVAISFFGFANIVGYIYSIIGVVGLILIIQSFVVQKRNEHIVHSCSRK